MKQITPIRMKGKFFAPIEDEINRILFEVIFAPILAKTGIKKQEIQNSKSTLYVSRKLLNAEDLIAWAKSQGFKSCLRPKDMHATICHSRAPIDRADIEKRSGNILVATASGRRCAKLGDKGAAVLFFSSSIIEARWRQFLEKHGASWDFESFNPHITISYDPGDIDLESIKPYCGALHFGGEIHERIIGGARHRMKEIKNAADPLSTALRSGKIYFKDGKFFGEFNSRTSKALRDAGAKFSKSGKYWTASGALPPPVSMAIADAAARASARQLNFLDALDGIDLKKIDEVSNISGAVLDAIDQINDEFEKTITGIGIAPKMTQAQKNILAAEWGQNLDLYIKNWASESIIDLRKEVQKNTLAGKRSKSLIEGIEKKYAVSRRKAKFLARQETSLMMSKFKESRYKSLGSEKYRWSGSMDERERPDHKALEGTIQTWDNPPVVDRKTGRKAHPGEDFGCRCVAVAIID